MSKEQISFVKKEKLKKYLVLFTQLSIFIIFIILWQYSSEKGLINSFITSSPKKIALTVINLFKSNNLLYHIWITTKETIIAFLLTTIISLLISIILYSYSFLAKVLDPYLTMLNSLPKVALGPIIIIWIGANTKGIITMAILISLIVSIQSIYNGFKNTDQIKIKLLKSFNATRLDILSKVVIPSNKDTIINTFKINISMCLIGVIMGEFLTSKAGIGYLILYGSQVFNLDLVMSGIFILAILSYLMYRMVILLEHK